MSPLAYPAIPSSQSPQCRSDGPSHKSKSIRRTHLFLGGKFGTPNFSGTRNPDEMQEDSVLTDREESESTTQKRSDSLTYTQHWISTETPPVLPHLWLFANLNQAPTNTAKLPALDISVYAAGVGGTTMVAEEEVDDETDEGVLL